MNVREIDYRAGERVEIDCTHLIGAMVGACAACIAKAIAAAEERGRRRGVEERDGLRAQMEEQDRSATRWAHMYNDLFHSLEPWLRKRLCVLKQEIARGDAYLAGGPKHLWDVESWDINATGWRKVLPEYRAEQEAIDAALASRDSAPVCDAVVSSDPFREWRCGKLKGHAGPHSGEAPRDSGKVT